MTSATFKPIVYLKENCPFCLKVRLFLLESGLAPDVETRDFVSDSEHEKKIRAELQPHLDKVSSLSPADTSPNPTTSLRSLQPRQAAIRPA